MHAYDVISHNFWLIALVVTVVNWAIYQKRAQKYIEQDSSLKPGYDALLRGYLVWTNIPWVVMGLGSTVGGVPTIWHYFRPQDGNPFVLLWYVTIFLLWLLGTYWIFIRGGAETLASHPGMITFRIGMKYTEVTSPTLIKVFWLLGLMGGIVGVVLMLTNTVPVPI